MPQRNPEIFWVLDVCFQTTVWVMVVTASKVAVTCAVMCVAHQIGTVARKRLAQFANIGCDLRSFHLTGLVRHQAIGPMWAFCHWAFIATSAKIFFVEVLVWTSRVSGHKQGFRTFRNAHMIGLVWRECD